MSSITILRQPKAFQPKDGSFAHQPEFAWFVHALADDKQYAGYQEEDVILESLEFFGKNAWDILKESELFNVSRLDAFESSVTLPDGTLTFYPVARLRSSQAQPLNIELTYSAEELAYLNNELLEHLSINHFKLTRQARMHLGSGEIPGSHAVGSAAVELLELELSDGSVLLGWGWVWYHA